MWVCFIFDIHKSVYDEWKISKNRMGKKTKIIYSGINWKYKRRERAKR